MPPAATLTLAAAPGVLPAPAVPVADPLLDAPEPAAPLPVVVMLPDICVEVGMTIVVLLFALTTIVRVWLNMEPVPGRMRVVRPVPMAGMSAGSGCVVTTAGCEVITEGCEVMTEGWAGIVPTLVATENMPVTTPRLSVCDRSRVAGWASTEDCWCC
jgi:hypothetical protein